jgi:hypothetical protein
MMLCEASLTDRATYCTLVDPPGANNTTAQQQEKGTAGGLEGGVGRPKNKMKRVLASEATVTDGQGQRRVGSVRRRSNRGSALCVVKQGQGAFEVGLAASCAQRIRQALGHRDEKWEEEGSDTVLPKGWKCDCQHCAAL